LLEFDAIGAPLAEATQVAAAAALLSAGELVDARLAAAGGSGIVEVRRLAAQAYADVEFPAARALIDAAQSDPSPRVRLEALGALRSDDDAAERCTRYRRALEDPWLPVALAAIDGLASCNDAAAVLAPIAQGAWAERGWQPAAHAVVSLARLAPGSAIRAIVAAAEAEPWQLRMYAARAAGETGNTELLRALSADLDANVRHAAVRGLQARSGHAADDVYLAALQAADYQLVMAAASALAGSDATRVPDELFAALARITAEQRETSRDPRAALLRAIGEVGTAARAGELEPYVRDFDRQIAEQAAAILTRWTATAVAAAPQPLPATPFPGVAELAEMASTRATIRMAGGDSFTLALFPYDAPTHTARFVRLARAGYFDGLTLHRVVYNFVLQGGSPGANEYVGDGPFARDEITARSHVRGTIGTSTRGRDTGDGQIFINLVDNLRLDFDYTIFASVVAGEEVLDNVVEGAVIDSITFSARD
jgi:cyclophilin family peptidyl-prolyl cis-trans isomerase/HEAT repeat protein